MKKKIFTLLTLLVAVCSGAWADYYTPTADEVIVFNSVYNSAASPYSNHSAVSWAGTVSFSNKTVGDPANIGSTITGSSCSVKGNGKGKNLTLAISGVSKLTVFHESQSSRYVVLEITPDGESKTTESGTTSSYYDEFELDGTKSYSIFFKGWDGSANQDVYVYAVKLTKYVSRTIATQTFTGVKLDGTALTADAAENGYSVDGTTITLSDDLVAYATPTTVTLTNHVVYTDSYEEDKNVDVTFDGTITAGYYVGTATIGGTTYTVKMKQNSQSITAVSLSGVAMSSSDLATLNSTHAVSVDGSSINGVGNLALTLTGGTTTITRTFDGDDVNFTFTLNASVNYTVTYTDVKKTYTLEGLPVYFSKDGTEVDGKNTNTVTANGISFAMVNTGKTFQYGAGSATISGNAYVPLKLSTGSGVNVTFPSGKVATKVIVYGWSINGDGAIHSISETSESTPISTSSDIFYATNNSTDIYPSVYEYDLDNWSTFYFNPGGSASQPFVVMEFVLIDNVAITPAYDKSTYVAPAKLDFSDVEGGLKAYVATAAAGGVVTLEPVGAVPAGTPLMLVGTAGTEYTVPVAASASAPAKNMFVAGDGTTVFDGTTFDYILYTDGLFYQIGSGSVPVGKAYLHCDSNPTTPHARELSISFGDDITGIDQIDNGQLTIDNSQDGKFIENGKLVIVKNGVKYNAAGAQVK